MKKHDWENLEVIHINKELGHSYLERYDSVESTLHKDLKYKLPLNGTWQFKYAKNHEERPKEFHKKSCSIKEWDSINVPIVWELQGYDKPYYSKYGYPPAVDTRKNYIPRIDLLDNPVGSYYRTFTLKKEWLSQNVFIYFGAVKSAFYLWVNGEFVGYSQGSMTPAEFNITSYIQKGENSLAVAVYRYCDGTYLEEQDHWFLSGICGEVFLYVEPKQYIRDHYARAVFANHYKEATFKLNLWVKNTSGREEPVQLTVYLKDPKKKETILTLEGRMVLPNYGEKAYFLEEVIKKPLLWSAEKPHLYEVIMELKDYRQKVIEVKKFHFGFRDVTIDNGSLKINGEPILIKGINHRHFNPETGWYFTEEDYHRELKLLKQHNINAIRTKYPNDDKFYELCDQYGFYVMDEAEISAYSIKKLGIPGDKDEWTKGVVDRVTRMVLKDRNYACIIMWSLGNEAGYGKNFIEMKKEAKALDDTRPFHYEGDQDLRVSDVLSFKSKSLDFIHKVGQMEDISFTFREKIEKRKGKEYQVFRAKKYQEKPVIFCEFPRAIEEENFADYVESYKSYSNLAGGFVWDFLEQMIKNEENEQINVLDDGDFTEEQKSNYPYNKYFLVADYPMYPSMDEVKKVYQSIGISPLEGEPTSFMIKNEFYFKTLDEYYLKWAVEQEGEEILNGTFELADIGPRESKIIQLPLASLTFSKRYEYQLTFDILTKEETHWCNKDFCVAWEQFRLYEKVIMPTLNLTSSIEVREVMRQIEITGENFEVVIDKNNGMMKAYNYKGKALLKAPIVPNFGSIDNNELVTKQKKGINDEWGNVTYHIKDIKIQQDGNLCLIQLKGRHKLFKGDIYLNYTLSGKGQVVVDHEIVPKKDMLGFGMLCQMPYEYHYLHYYGKGPQKAYYEREQGSKMGQYTTKVQRSIYSYSNFQEKGKYKDVLWFDLKNSEGEGLRISSYSQTYLNMRVWIDNKVTIENKIQDNKSSQDKILTVIVEYPQKNEENTSKEKHSYILEKDKKYRYQFIIEPIEK